MTIYRALAELPADITPSALTIGNFDGVHVGHQHLMARVVSEARQQGWTPSVLTFDPHPTRLVAPQRAPKLLSTPAQRAELMRKQGIERIVILPFTQEIARLNPEEFVREVLAEKLKTRVAFVGDNFRFGHRATGDITTLERLGEQYCFTTEIVGAVAVRGRLVSSSAIRELVAQGRMAQACRMLGRPYSLEGPVVDGRGIGSKQTVPTLNLRTPLEEVIPARGVYITRTVDAGDGRSWDSITNAGYRPTFDGDALTVETFLLSHFDGRSPERIRVQFLRFVREERKFDSAESLRAQILRDAGRARTYFRRIRLSPKRLDVPAYTGSKN